MSRFTGMNATRSGLAATIAVLLMAGCASAAPAPPVAASSPTSAPLTSPPAASPLASAPAASPDAAGVDTTAVSTLPQFRCEDQSGGGTPGSSITAVRDGLG